MELIYTALFLIPTIWVGPFWLMMMVEAQSERTSKWVEGNLIFLGPLVAYFVTIMADPSGMIELFTGNPTEIMDTMGELLGTESGTVLAWTHFVAGDIIATRWMWRKAVENEIGLNQTRVIVFFGVMLMPVGLLLHMVLNRE
jgi:hypothetical protein